MMAGRGKERKRGKRGKGVRLGFDRRRRESGLKA
jgi:hypothetical protein